MDLRRSPEGMRNHGGEVFNNLPEIRQGSLVVITMIDVQPEQSIQFIVNSARILDQVHEVKGNLYHITHKEGRKYYTLTVWRNRGNMEAFRNSEPHKSAMRRVSEYGSETRFWSGERMPMTWDEAKEILVEEGRTTQFQPPA